LKAAVNNARLGRDEKLHTLKRLDDQARMLEGAVEGPSFEAFVARERDDSVAFGGRSVFGWEQDLRAKKTAR
jgi:hypothetical protein